MSYPYCLPPESYIGYINGILVQWPPTGPERLALRAYELQVPQGTLKALCENFSYLAAYRLGHIDITIR